MAKEKISMTNLKLLLQHLSNGDSINSIKDILHMSKKTVIKYRDLAKSTGLSYPSLLTLDEPELCALMLPDSPVPQTDAEKQAILEPLLPEYAKRLGNGRYANRLSLWEDYQQRHKDDPCGYYQYTQFKHYLNEYCASKHYSYINTYTAGREWQIDYAGDVLHTTDMKTGERTPAVLLVCIMPYSNFTFAYAMYDARQELFFDGLNHGLLYMGALPHVAKSDNMKQWMKRYDRYEPNYAEESERWCLHYGIMPEKCRPKKPRDKGPVESAVNQVYKYIYARIESETFYSLAELNSRILELLDAMNDKPVRGMDRTRRQIFEEDEKPNMDSIPEQMYVFRYSKVVKLLPSYHVTVGRERHRYSVPYQYVNKEVKVLWNVDTVEIYYNGMRIAEHKREFSNYKPTTLDEHMPPEHLAYKKSKMMNANAYLEWAVRVGPDTKWAVEQILSMYKYPEQGYSTCNGLIGTAKKYGWERVEKGCRLIHEETMCFTLRSLRNILDNNRDKYNDMKDVSCIPENPSTRGAETYNTIVTNTK